MTGWTLEEALSQGQGTERPFRCPSHEDRFASASVNVLKGVWYCYACHASGGTDKKHVPSGDDLLSMLEPEKAPRIYPESYLDLFDNDDAYWQSRFPQWLCWAARLGHDPFTGNDTFPVRTPQGLLAGVGLRVTNANVEKAKIENRNPSRYKYPFGWSASTTLGGVDLVPRSEHYVLTEGFADAVSLWEVGIPALACYGAGLHYPQLETLFRLRPDHVLLGFDMDNAGDHAAQRSYDQIKEVIPKVTRIEWPEKDPAECTSDQRREAVFGPVGGRQYVAQQWSQWSAETQARYAHATSEETS